MPRFYFHYRGPDDQLIEDHVGNEQADIESAEREAHRLAADILEEELAEGYPVLGPRCLEIENEQGEIVLYLPFWSLLTRRPAHTITVH